MAFLWLLTILIFLNNFLTKVLNRFGIAAFAQWNSINWSNYLFFLFQQQMFLTRSEYDRGVNTFSPEGRLFQVEYAIEAIKLGSTAIGIRTPEGVVMAVEKRITSPLMEPSTVEKIVEVDKHVGCATSGLMADARYIIRIIQLTMQYS